MTQDAKYAELKSAMQKLIFGGSITPDLKAVLVRHEIISVPDIDARMIARCADNIKRLREPMRDEELGIHARKEIPALAQTLLNVIPVVRAAVVFRSTLLEDPTTAQGKDLVSKVDTFLEEAGN